MLLIKTEVLAKLNQQSMAIATLESLMENRDPEYDFSEQPNDPLEEIYLQRRIELWGEGFAFTNLKRLQKGLNRAGGLDNHNPEHAVYLHIEHNDDLLLWRIPGYFF